MSEPALEDQIPVLAAALDAVGDAVIIKDADLVIRYANAAACRHAGLPPGGMTGKRASDFFCAATAYVMERDDRTVLDSGRTLHVNRPAGLESTGGADATPPAAYRKQPIMQDGRTVGVISVVPAGALPSGSAPSALLLDRFFRQSLLSIACLDRSLRFLWVNESYARGANRPRADFIGRGHFELYPHTENEALFRRVLETGEHYHEAARPFEHPDRPDQPMTFWDLALQPIRDEAGAVDGLILTLMEVTEREQAREQARRLTERLSLATRSAGIGVWEYHIETRALIWDAAMFALYGIDPGAFKGTLESWTDSVHPDDIEQAMTAVTRAVEGEKPFDATFRIVRPCGAVRFMRAFAEIVPAANGDPARMVGVNYDITDRVEPLQRLEKISRSVPGVIYQYRLDANGHASFPYASEGIREIYGVMPEDVREDAGPVFAVLHPDDVARVQASIARSAETLGLWSCDYRVSHPTRGVIWVYGRSVPERQPDGAILWHGAILDVTERKALEDDLRRSHSELEQFAFAASHDLRQPLRMINSFTGLLEKTLADTLDDDAREMMAFVRDGTRQMDEMLVSLLEYSRVGRLREQPEPHDIRALLDAALSHLVVELEDSGATVDIRGDWPMLSVSGAEALRLFENLIGNALKYRAPDRAPVITVAVEKDGAMWRFSVADNGIGIEPSQTERVFKVFERLHTRQDYEGAGIGLAICRKIVEHHGGAIWIESAGADQGTTVIFTLPSATGEAEPAG